MFPSTTTTKTTRTNTTTTTFKEITQQHTNSNTCSIMWTGCERSSSRAIETTINGNGAGGHGGDSSVNVAAGPGSSQQETLADIEHISTIAGSLVSIGSISHTQPRYGTNDAGYDTEHTSLNSDFDEAELRRELLRDKWKILFDMFDPEGFGEITVDEFIIALKSPEFISQVPLNKRELLLERAKKAKTPIGPGYITFQDFVNVICYPSGKEYTNKEIATLSIRIAVNLQKLHVEQCDVIGLCAANSDFVAPLTFGALLCGLSVSTLDPSFDKAGIRHAFSITKPKLMFCDASIYDKVNMALKECGLFNTPIYAIGNHIEGAANLTELMVPSDKESSFKAPNLQEGWNQVAMILCSSGTTGMPKAVTMSHAGILNSVKFEMSASDKFLCFSSLYWLTGLMTLIHGTIRGVTRVISNRPYAPNDFLDIVERFKVNIVLSPPSQIAMTLAEDRINETDLSSIELYMSGGSLVPYMLIERFKKYAPNAVFVVGYGMSEVCVWVAHQEMESRNSVGRLDVNIEIKIIDDEGNSLLEQQVGEICIRSPYHWPGYYNNPEATANIYDKNCWIHSGDVGYFDSEGRLYIVDRKKDILKYNNFHFYPAQIEKVIIELPEIIDACVVGIPDITFTHLPAAAIVVRPNSNITEEYVYEYVASKLQHFEHLRGGVYFVDSLPRTVSGKTIRRQVAELCENLYKQRNLK